MSNRPLQLVSKEGVSFSLSRVSACGSALLEDMMKNASLDEPIHFPSISTGILDFVVEYLDHFANSTSRPSVIQKPLISANFAELVSAWENQFAEKPHEVLFELILAANYLCMQGLVDLTAAKVASMVKGRSPEEIRRTFNIVNEFTPEEEAQIREENKWAEEL